MTPPVSDMQAGVYRIEVPLEGAALIDATNCFVIEDTSGGLHLVDPGAASAPGEAALVAGLAALGRGYADVRSIIVTHAHHDHIGLADRIATEGVRLVLGRHEPATLSRTSGPVATAVLDAWGVPEDARAELVTARRAELADAASAFLVDDGDVLDIPGHDVTVVHTPGHTRGSICLLVDRELMLTGDTVLPQINPGLGLGGFGPSDDIIGMALDTLDRLAAAGDLRVGPGHGEPFDGLARRSLEQSTRHRSRAAEIERLGASGETSVWSIAQRVGWTGGWDAVRSYLRVSALAQTEMHLRRLEGAVRYPDS